MMNSGLLTKLALLARVSSGAAKPSLKTMLSVMAYVGCAVLFIGLATGYAAYALYMLMLAHAVEPSLAAIAVAAILLFLSAILFYCAGSRMKNEENSRSKEAEEAVSDISEELVNTVLKSMEEPMQNNPLATLAVVAAAGFLFGNKFKQ